MFLCGVCYANGEYKLHMYKFSLTDVIQGNVLYWSSSARKLIRDNVSYVGSAVKRAGTELFRADFDRHVTYAEVGIFGTGWVMTAAGLYYWNKKLLRTGLSCMGISIAPGIVSRAASWNWEERKDTYVSSSASLLSVIAAAYYCKKAFNK